jgi:hypothetical protein
MGLPRETRVEERRLWLSGGLQLHRQIDGCVRTLRQRYMTSELGRGEAVLARPSARFSPVLSAASCAPARVCAYTSNVMAVHCSPQPGAGAATDADWLVHQGRGFQGLTGSGLAAAERPTLFASGRAGGECRVGALVTETAPAAVL